MFIITVLQLSISVHQRSFMAFKMHRIHLRPGSAPDARLGARSPHSLVGWDLEQGGAAERTFTPGATDLGAATQRHKHATETTR